MIYNDQGYFLCDAKDSPNDIFESDNTIVTFGKNFIEFFFFSKNNNNNNNPNNNNPKIEKSMKYLLIIIIIMIILLIIIIMKMKFYVLNYIINSLYVDIDQDLFQLGV